MTSADKVVEMLTSMYNLTMRCYNQMRNDFTDIKSCKMAFLRCRMTCVQKFVLSPQRKNRGSSVACFTNAKEAFAGGYTTTCSQSIILFDNRMSIYKNGIYSASDTTKDEGYENLAQFDDSYNKRHGSQFIINNNKKNNNNNNNIHRVDYITLPKSRPEHEHSTYLFWTLVVLLFILAFGNLVLTFVILGVLRLGQGMESLELVPEEMLIKFFGSTDLDNIYKRDGKLESFNESPMEILGDVGNIHIGLSDTESEINPSMSFGPKLEAIENIDSFIIKHPITGKSIFSTDFPNFGLPRGVDKLDVQIALTKRISSAVNEGLLVKSDTYIKLKGSEGIHISGKEVIWSADQDIFLKSVNKSIILSGNDGMFIDVRNIPVASKVKDLRSHTQYKICVCMPEGKLFRLPIHPGQNSYVSCQNIDHSIPYNPCL